MKPYGYDVDVEIRTSIIGSEVKTFNKVGSEASVRRWAMLKDGAIKVVAVRPYDRSQYEYAFGRHQRM